MLISGLSCANLRPNDATHPEVIASWKGCHLSMLIKDYSEKSGMRVEVVQGVDLTGKVSLEWQGSISNYFTMIEAVLRTNNIGLFHITSNRVVVTWVDSAAR
jgi:hypothetical protein